MYVTRPLLLLQKSAENLGVAPEGPNSGFLVIQDEESETYSIFGLRKNRTVKKLPFPQDKELTVRYPSSWDVSIPIEVLGDLILEAAIPIDDSSHSVLFVPALNYPLSSNRYYAVIPHGKHKGLDHLPFPQDKELTIQYVTHSGQATHVSLDPLFMIPALNHPVSSNRYYAVVPHRKRIGEAFTCSREEDKVNCFFCRSVKDVKSRPLDPRDPYQQVEILPYDGICNPAGNFRAKSVAPDGFPPYFLRRKGWTIYTKNPDTFMLEDAALGLNASLRSRLLELDSPGSRVIGKWYTPFVFVKEWPLRDPVKKSMFYEITLEQRWEEIFKIDYVSNGKGNKVVVEGVVEKEEAFVGGRKAKWEEKSGVDGVIWFKAIGGGGGVGVGLRVEVVERMKWEQKRGGWIGGEEREVKINRVEEFGGVGNWSEFRCYVLVERFNVKRMDV